MKQRLDHYLVSHGLALSRSSADNWIRLGKVFVDGAAVTKSGYFVPDGARVELRTDEQYVSRAGLKLASIAAKLDVDFDGKIVLDVGSSTGGFTDYALQHGAVKVVAVDVGTDQLHPSLRGDERIELHEKTDIREVGLEGAGMVIERPDIVVIDVSFISLREILPHVQKLLHPESVVLAMLKPQFEAGKQQVNKGIIKNDTVRRDILRNFENWVKNYFTAADKADSEVAGAKGNRERFYKLLPKK